MKDQVDHINHIMSSSANFPVLFAKYKRACITGYCIRCIYGLYLALRSKNKSKTMQNTLISKLKQIFLTLNHYQFASTIGLTTVTYTWITNFLHKKQPPPLSDIDEHNPLNTFIINKSETKIKLLAITIAMTWFKALPKEFREMIVLHLFIRAIYDLIKLFKYDNEYKILPQIPHDEMYIGAATLTTVGYGIYHNPWIFDQGFYKFILKWGSNTHTQIGNVFRSKTDPLSSVRLQGEAFVECVPEWHTDPSCFRYHMKNIGRDFLRSNGMYAFVHLSSLVISVRFWKLCYRIIYSIFVRNDDIEVEEDRMKLFKLLRHKLIAIIRSSMFFVCFQHFSKLIQCYWRYYILRGDPIWSTLGCVYIATLLAECFETPQRRIQYTLYTSTHIIRMIGNAIQIKYGDVINRNNKLKWIYEWWSVIVLQMTFGIWCYMKSIGKSEEYCGKWSLTAMNIIL
eukprot:176009_1